MAVTHTHFYDGETFSPVAMAAATDRASFIAKTYMHLAGAIFAFAGLCALLLSLPGIDGMMMQVFAFRWAPLALMGGFMLVSWIADSWARSDASPALQYLGLGLYVVAEAVIFMPILYIASRFYPNAIETAGIATLFVFGGLSVVVFATRKDFSFLAPILGIGCFAALAIIVCGMLFGFELGLFFTVGMIVLASGYILYDTSNIMHHYRIGQHVAASLALFASVAMLFFYILRFVMEMQRSNR